MRESIFTPPMNIAKRNFGKKYIFLGGTIDNNKSVDWQKEMSEFASNSMNGWGVFNPRRLDWDKNLRNLYEQPEFFQQVQWELNALNHSDLILLNLLPDSVSPITLLELGLYATCGKLHVVCPEGF